MIDQVIEILKYTIPSIVTGLVAYYFFLRLSRSESNAMKVSLLKEDKKIMLPARLQAYERMTLFMERINPTKLLVRVIPTSDNKELYTQKLLQSIDQEFEYNFAQQIYVSEACWNVIITSKNTTAQIIKSISEDTSIQNSQELRTAVIKHMINNTAPSATCISYIKDEVKNYF